MQIQKMQLDYQDIQARSESWTDFTCDPPFTLAQLNETLESLRSDVTDLSVMLA